MIPEPQVANEMVDEEYNTTYRIMAYKKLTGAEMLKVIMDYAASPESGKTRRKNRFIILKKYQ